MKKILATTTIVAAVVTGAVLLPNGASAASVSDLAKSECREERRDDRAEFVRDFGNGPGAIQRCITREIRRARADCRFEKRFEAAEFRAEYGTGQRAMNRCVRDEIR